MSDSIIPNQCQSWSSAAGRYEEEFIDPDRPGVRNPLRPILTRLAADGAKSVADLGCGTGPLLPFLAEHFAEVFAIDFAPGMLDRAQEPNLPKRAKEVLGRCFHEKRSLGELSDAVGCSPFYLARVFRRVDGRSIHQYRLQQRLARSLERIATGHEVAEVAFDLGFSSHSHFTATFRRAFGLTPVGFRRQATASRLRSLRPQRVPLTVSLAAPEEAVAQR